ncbi:unnamed protein product [Ilex paraguariensis]|uniref:RING-type domain-containing protein n=1 Tax=Ilex paraguariensis TaxID=185542 RepID=A0ABC8V1X3_9AQUA
MGSDKPNTEDIEPTEAADWSKIFHNSNSVGADCMSFPYMPLPDGPHYQSYAHDIRETGGNLMADFMKVNSLQNAPIDPNTINPRYNFPRFVRGSDISPPVENLREMHQPVNHDNMVTYENEMIGGHHLGSFRSPQMNRRFMPMSSIAAGTYQMSGQGGEAEIGSTNEPQINRNFVDIGCSTPMLYHTHNFGEIGTDNNVKVSEVQVSCLEGIDGSFLTLGIGDRKETRSKPEFDSWEIARKLNETSPHFCNSQVQQTTRIGGKTETRSKSKFDTRQIASKLEETVSLDFSTPHVQQTIRNSSSMGHNLAADHSSPVYTVDDWTSSHNDAGVIHSANPGLSSTSLRNIQSLQRDVRNTFFVPSNRISGFAGRKDARTADLDPYQIFQCDRAPSSLPLSGTSAGFLGLGHTGFPGLALGPANPSWISTRPTSNQLQDCYSKHAKNFFSESSMNSSFLSHRESSSKQDHPGQLIPCSEGSTTQSSESGQPLRRIGVQPVGRLFSAHEISDAQAAVGRQVPKRSGVQVTEGSAAQAGASGPFPKRLGVHFNESVAAQIAEAGPFPRGMGLETFYNIQRSQGTGPVQPTKNLLRPPIAIGWPHDSVPAQFSVDLHGPSSTAGRSQDAVPVHVSKDCLRPVSTTGQGIPVAKAKGVSQASDVLGARSFKRGAIQPPPAARWVQRRKITPQPIIHPSMPYATQSAAPIPIPAIAPAAAHIKWQGLDGRPPQPTGHKCLICKRDLSFTPDGPVYQPGVAPAVAVLPCGHTFHDHCLQIITPDDQVKDPPCIPCAMGET